MHTHSRKHTDSVWIAHTLSASHSPMIQGLCQMKSPGPTRITARLGFQSRRLPIALTIGQSFPWEMIYDSSPLLQSDQASSPSTSWCPNPTHPSRLKFCLLREAPFVPTARGDPSPLCTPIAPSLHLLYDLKPTFCFLIVLFLHMF